MDSNTTLGPTSEHFELRQLAEGVYAAIALEGSAARSNAGIIDLGEQTLIFDTFDAPAAARDLRAAAEHLTGRESTCVIISHSHADHWCGNQAFAPQVPIITSHGIREEMPRATAWLRELKEAPSELEDAIGEEKERLRTETDPRWIASLQLSLQGMGQRLEALPHLELVLPTQAFSGKLAFYGTQRRAKLIEVAPAHTAHDLYLLLPEDRIAFIGDLGFFQCQPFMAACEPRGWIDQLEALAQLDVETFVPGHGPLGTRADLALQKQYIAKLPGLVAEAIAQGLPPEQVLPDDLPPPLDAWLHGGMFRWEANVWSLYERMSGEDVDPK
jgi:glyoxylase-like metal-dependent hydrolase (beta-lactamase superfamily II)